MERSSRGRGRRGRAKKFIRYGRKKTVPAMKLSAAAAARFKELTTAPKVEPRMVVRHRKQLTPLQNVLHETQDVSPDGWAKQSMGLGFYFESDRDVLLPVSYWTIGVCPSFSTIISGMYVERSVPEHILAMLTMYTEDELPFIACFVEVTTSHLIRSTPASPDSDTSAPDALTLRRGPPRRAKLPPAGIPEITEIPDNQIKAIRIITNKPEEDKDYHPGDSI